MKETAGSPLSVNKNQAEKSTYSQAWIISYGKETTCQRMKPRAQREDLNATEDH